MDELNTAVVTWPQMPPVEMTGDRHRESATVRLSVCKAIPERMRHETRELSAMHVPAADRRKGYATTLLQDVCQEADAHGKTLLVFVKPYGDIEMSKTQLGDWYAKFGFQVIQEQPCLMARLPGSNPRRLSPITRAIEAVH